MKLSRRQFTRLATSAVAATLLGACRRATPAPPEGVSSATTAPSLQAPDAAAPAPSGRYRQAPTLDGIEYAHLLPVDDRLPRRPMVLGSEADVGGYGGALRRAILQTTYDRAEPEFRRLVLGQDLSEARQVVDSLDAHKLFAYDHDLVLRPWLCESWEYDEEGVWTLHLREGVRWSDGEPFTLQDVRFALEQSPRIGSEQAREMLRQRFEVVDDYLLRVHRASLDALDSLALIAQLSGLIVPSHPMRALFPESADADERQRSAL